MSAKRFTIITLCLLLVCLLVLGGINAYVDPFFHYRGPQENLNYRLHNQRYQNDGILRHFEYDAIITGSSMTENFKASEVDALFQTETVKASMSGTRFRETADQLTRAFAYNPDIKLVIQGLDYSALVADKDEVPEFDYPYYLYDQNPLNDVQYLLNKTVLLKETYSVMSRTESGQETTGFDDYGSWSDDYTYGKQEVLHATVRPEKSNTKGQLTAESEQMIRQNLQQNIVALAQAHPETEFYLFFPPYSIVYWDHWNQRGWTDAGIDVYRIAAEILLECDNIHLFSFDTCFDVICNLDNYKDTVHYGGWVNSQILQWMKEGEYELTKDNYLAHFEQMRSFYASYDYDAIYEP